MSAPPKQLSLEDGRTTLGKYEILRKLGAGGMGTVYLAIDSQLKRTVALKVLPKDRTENEILVRRFEAEAQSAAQLKHENIITVYDAGRADGHLFIALEYVDGTDVYELVAKRGSLPLKRSIEFVKQVARALEHLHQRGFVHRDIKPSNLLVTKEGVLKLTDMGLARAVDESLKSNITREGTTVGTVDYMAPEQARDSQAADIRSDIYSLGCTWYQMLTSEPPYPTGSVTNKLFSHISKPRPDPRVLNRSIPEEVVIILHRMMARKAADRYQTPAALLEDLEGLGKGNKRLDELLQADAEDDFTPSSSAPQSPPQELPARAARAPEARSHQTPSRGTSSPGTPSSATPSHGTPTHGTPAGRASNVLPPRHLPGRTAQPSQPSDNLVFETAPRPQPMPARQLPGSPRKRGQAAKPPRGARTVSNDPTILPGQQVAGQQDAILIDGRRAWAIDWKYVALKAAPYAGGLIAIGLIVWMWGRTGNGNGGADGPAKNPFEVAAAQDPNAKAETTEQAEVKTDPKEKTTASKDKAKAILVEAGKPAVDDKVARQSPVLGRPGERQHFPAWVEDVWEPNTAPGAKGTVALKTITVGRVGDERADVASLAAAFDKLPTQGGIIELRGRGPFLLPPVRIANRGRVIITGAQGTGEVGADKNASTSEKLGSQSDGRPLIAFVPVGGRAFESGLLATGTALTFYGVHLLAFADEFPGERAIRLVDVRAGDLTVRKSSLTLVGRRSGPTIAFSLSVTGASHPTRVLLDRTFLRGSDLTAIDADLQEIDLLAINSLFVTGRGPVVHLLGGSGEAASTAPKNPPRTLRLFSCTTCTEDFAFSLQPGSDAVNPPATRFQVLNSEFGSVFERQAAAMIALVHWPTSDSSPAHVKNLTWSSESLSVLGWQKLVQGDGNLQFGIKDGGEWAKFWGTPESTFDYRPLPFPAFTDLATVEPSRFKPDANLPPAGAGGDTGPRGCDLALLSVASAETIRRADAFSRRPTPPAPFQPADSGTAIKEINLDNPNRPDWEDLSKWINPSSGTRFRVRGKGTKACGPIRVTGKSLSIEFVEPAPLISFDVRKVESGTSPQAFISVSGGSVEIVHANFRIEPSTKASPRWLLEVKNGRFAIRDSTIRGPASENPGYEGLIHASTDATADRSPAAIAEAGFSGLIRNSFLCTVRSVLKADLPTRGPLFIDNAILAGSDRVFDLRATSASPTSPVLDLRSSTLASGGEYFYFDPGNAARTAGNLRIFAEYTIFAPPIQPQRNAVAKPVLVGGITATSVPDRVDWWEYACAYSNRLRLPGSESRRAGQPGATAGPIDPLGNWRRLAGLSHIVRSIADANAVILRHELPQARQVVSSDFHLNSEAQAATWSDVGTAIGAPSISEPAPAAPPTKQPVDRKSSGKRSKKPAPTTPSSGL